MTETWIEGAIKAPTTYDPKYPTGKDGYYEGEVRTLSDIRFVVNHDARGYLSYLVNGHRPSEQASWTFTNDINGILYQHKPLEKIAWTSSNRRANTQGIGVEHANLVGPWGVPQPFQFTDAQAVTDARLFTALQRVCPNLGAPALGKGVQIHKLVAPGTTTCDNGRGRYDEYDKLLTQEDDDMPLNDEDKQWITDEIIRILRAKPEFNIPGRLGAIEEAVAAIRSKIGA